jgi:hypothetical protein
MITSETQTRLHLKLSDFGGTQADKIFGSCDNSAGRDKGKGAGGAERYFFFVTFFLEITTSSSCV